MSRRCIAFSLKLAVIALVTTLFPMAESGGTNFRDSKAYGWFMLSLGWTLVLAAPLLGPLPGPGALVILPLGLAIILKHSRWAKKRYALLSRQNPEYGRWTDWAMRRSKATERPPFPDFKADIMHLFRRDDIDQPMA